LRADVINDLMREMRAEATAVVRQGSSAQDLAETRHAYMRYVGQGHEIAVPLPVGDYGADHAETFRRAFAAAYTGLYGRTIDGIDVEVLSWTLTIAAPAMQRNNRMDDATGNNVPQPASQQSFFDPASASRTEVPVFYRAQLAPGDRICGPALITEDQTTTVVTANYDAGIDARGYIIMVRRERA